MRRMLRHGLFGGGVAALLLLPPTSLLMAQELVSPLFSSTLVVIAPPPVTKPPAPAKPAAKTAARTAPPAHPAHKVVAASAKPKAPEKVATAAKKPEPTIAAKQPEPAKLATAAPPPAPAPSYTSASTREDVTHRTAQVAPIPTVAPTVDPPAAAKTVPAAPGDQLAALPRAATPQPAMAPTATLASASAVTPPRPASPSTVTPPAHMPAMPATSFVSAFLQKAFSIARNTSLNSLQRRAQLADLFTASMDVSRIAGYTTGDELTTEPNDFQRRFRAILISYLVETYYPRIELAADPSVTVATTPGSRTSDGTTVVWTTFNKSDWVSQSVKWQLVPDGDGYKIVDIFSAGASLVQLERDTFLSVMRSGGLPELMAKLDARTKALAGAATE
jgi:ABC-type transporter MlaC component